MIDVSGLRAIELTEGSKQAHEDYLKLLSSKNDNEIVW